MRAIIIRNLRSVWSTNPGLRSCAQALRTHWWWAPLLLLSALAGSAAAPHQKERPPVPAKAAPTLLVRTGTSYQVRGTLARPC